MRDTLRSLHPILGEAETKRIWHAFLVSNPTDRRELEQIIEAYAARLLDDVPTEAPAGLFPPAPAEVCKGDIPLGRVKYGAKKLHPFGLRQPELLRHVGIYGSSGAGKSNGIALIVDGLMRNKVPFILIDFKRTFRALAKDYPDLLVFTVGDERTAPLRVNPLIPPPSCEVSAWIRKVVGALSHAYCQGAGSESLLLTALTEAYRVAGAEGCWPTFLDVLKILNAEPARGRKGMWADSARRAVERVSADSTGQIFCPIDSMSVEALLRRPVVIEMDQLSPAEQTFFSEFLLLWIIQLRMNEPEGRETLKGAFIIEEAHHLLRSPPGIGDGSEPVIHTSLREARELGLAIFTCTQTASLCPTTVFGNQATTLAFHTKHQKDVQSTAQAMLLKDESKDELGRLPVGEAIVKCPRWHSPMRIKLEYRPIDKGSVTDAALRERMAKLGYFRDSSLNTPSNLESLPNTLIPPAAYKQDNTAEPPHANRDVFTPQLAPPTTTPKEDTDRRGPTELEKAMLTDIVEHPFDGVVQRIQRVHTSRRKGTAALKALLGRGFIDAVPIWTGKALLKLFDVNQSGQAYCRENDIGPLPEITEGGVEHRYHVQKIGEELKQLGYSVEKEYPVNTNLTVDLHAEREDRVVAVLVETGKSNVPRNIEKTASAGYSEIWVLSDNPAVKSLVARTAVHQKAGTCIKFSPTNLSGIANTTRE